MTSNWTLQQEINIENTNSSSCWLWLQLCMRVWKNMPCVTQSLSLGDNWVSPEENSFQHNYTMNNGEMVIRTKDIANCSAVSTRRNDVEDAYYTGLHLYLYMHALTLINKTKQNTTQHKNKQQQKKQET